MADAQQAEPKKGSCAGTLVLVLMAFAAGFLLANETLRNRMIQIISEQFGTSTSADYEGGAKPGEVEQPQDQPQTSDEVVFQFVPSKKYAIEGTLRDYLQQNGRDYLLLTAFYRKNASEKWRRAVDVPLDFCSFPVAEHDTAGGPKTYVYMDGSEIELPATFKFQSSSYREQNYLYRWYANVTVRKPGVYRVEYQRLEQRSALREPQTREELALAQKYRGITEYINVLQDQQREYVRDHGKLDRECFEELQRRRAEKRELEEMLSSKQIKVPY